MRKGLIHVYTGDGKGKTTAALGLVIRALGYNMKVCWVYFHKNPKKFGYGEIEILKKLGTDIYGFAESHPSCDDVSFEKMRVDCLAGLKFIEREIFEKNYDILVLDEIIIAVRDKFISENELLDVLNKKPEKLEIILTGRGATERIINYADLVSEIKKMKHPYDSGVLRRRGIEY